MILPFVLALMTAAAIFAVMWPLSRRGPLRTGSDVAVYRDQIHEIERDREAGLIGESEAEAARVEVSRRLLGAADTAVPARSPVGTARRRRAAAFAALVLLPLGAVTFYLLLGSPRLPGQPARSAAMRRSRNSARPWNWSPGRGVPGEDPEDGRAWDLLGPVYMRLGQYADAVRARRARCACWGSTAGRGRISASH